MLIAWKAMMRLLLFSLMGCGFLWGETSPMGPVSPAIPLPPAFIRIDLTQQNAEMVVEGKQVWRSEISSGREEKPTPIGEFKVSHKHEDWTSTIYHIPMPHFLRLNGGSMGLHAGKIPGYPGSAGCIRLPAKKAEELFALVEVGTPVLIEGVAPTIEELRREFKEAKMKEAKRRSTLRLRNRGTLPTGERP